MLRMPSLSRVAPRRKPQQIRATERQAHFLESAATLFARKGYEAVTMTEVAKHAHASIGALYDYFPNKQSLAVALATKYTEEGDVYWPERLEATTASTAEFMAQSLVDGILEFVRERPAYPLLLGIASQSPRTPAARQPLRAAIAGALRKMDGLLAPEAALFHAEVVIELLKALLSLYSRSTSSGQKENIIACFKGLLAQLLTEMPCSMHKAKGVSRFRDL